MQANPVKLEINEVGTRDGLQNECAFVPTDEKVKLVNQLSRLGYSKIEVTSFTSAQAIPALRDAEAVMKQIDRVPHVTYTALVPNARGADRAIECKVDEFNLVMSASATHNLTNLRMTQEQSFESLAGVLALGKGSRVPSNVSLSCVFGCPMEGEVALDDVLRWVERFAREGAIGITLCDTTGMAYPTQVEAVCNTVLARFPELIFTAHFHNTRGMGLANTVAAVNTGIRYFDMSLGGLGGCPYAPGASGNVATEDVVHMLECMGYRTGVDLGGLLQAAKVLEALVGHELPAQVSRAGARLTRHPVPADFEQIRTRALERDAAARSLA